MNVESDITVMQAVRGDMSSHTSQPSQVEVVVIFRFVWYVCHCCSKLEGGRRTKREAVLNSMRCHTCTIMQKRFSKHSTCMAFIPLEIKERSCHSHLHPNKCLQMTQTSSNDTLRVYWEIYTRGWGLEVVGSLLSLLLSSCSGFTPECMRKPTYLPQGFCLCRGEVPNVATHPHSLQWKVTGGRRYTPPPLPHSNQYKEITKMTSCIFSLDLECQNI